VSDNTGYNYCCGYSTAMTFLTALVYAHCLML